MSWNLVILFSTSLLLTGKLVDWSLRKSRKESLLKIVSAWENGILGISITMIEYKIASLAVRAYVGFSTRSRRYAHREGCLLYLGAIILASLVSSIVLSFSGPGLASVTSSTVPGYVMLLTFVAAAAYMIVGSPLAQKLDHLFLISCGSIAVSTCALVLASNLPRAAGIEIAPVYMYAIFTINIPFDCIAVSAAIRLLSLAIDKGWPLWAIAVLNIFVAGFLSFLLAVTTLLFIGKDVGLARAIMGAASWFAAIATGNGGGLPLDLYLLSPLFLSTTLPVAFYMSAFIFVSFVLRPGLRIGAYLCGLLGEKKDSPFLELGTAISILVTLVKSLFEVVALFRQNAP